MRTGAVSPGLDTVRGTGRVDVQPLTAVNFEEAGPERGDVYPECVSGGGCVSVARDELPKPSREQ
jgi:hypothetical protein